MTMNYQSIIKECDDAMNKAVEHLRKEFKGVRTGRASTAMVENVQVDYYGSRQPLKNMANISVADASSLAIKPFDRSQVKIIVKAIQEANLGFNPMDDGQVIRIVMPPMTEENRKKIAVQLKDMAEHCKVTVRNARQASNKHADTAGKDKASGLTEDTLRELKEEIQTKTNHYTKQIDDVLKEKTVDVMKI